MVSLLPSKNASHPMDAATRRNRLRRAILETLERRELMAADVCGVFAPNTTAEYREAWESLNSDVSGALPQGGNSDGQTSNFNATAFRWTNPTGGATPTLGDPATVSWSIVPDGTLNSRDNLNSNLIGFMDSIYGGGSGPVANRPWFNLVKSVFDRWSQQTGLTYVYEAADDGTAYGGNANRGVSGVRGDVRIGGNRIDGDFGVLAYNFYPSGGGNAGFDGDMVIDTADRFYRDVSNGPTGENRGLSNVLTHEAGHGLGLGHVFPINDTKLMEPNVSLAFFGIQHDDLLGAQQLYGDDREKNNTTTTATDLATLGNGTLNIGNVSVNGITGDNDWYKFQIPAAGRVTLNLAPVGQQYTVGSEGGPAPAPVNSQRYVDLQLELVAADGTVLASVNNGGLGANETITNLQLPSGGQYFIRVFGAGANPQLYNLTITLAGIVTQTAQVTGPRLLSVAPNSGEIFNFNSVNTLSSAPTELVLRFAGGSDLDAATLANGIRIMRAGRDGKFDGTGDQRIVPGYIGFGDNTSIVVLRFAETLPDDLYRVEVMGEAVPAEGLVAIRNTLGDKLTPRLAGTDRDVYNFQLKLGAQVIAVVPQPVLRNPDGTLAPQLNKIRVYFNNDDLDAASATSPNFYQLVYTSESVQPNDDVRFIPTSVTYDPATDMAELTFSARIDQLAGAGSYRLRVGSSTVVNSVSNLPVVPLVAPAADPTGFFGTATSLDAQLAAGSVKVNETLNNTGNPLLLDFMGSDLDPGNRDINNSQDDKEDNHVGNTGDSSPAIATATYTFSLNASYGNDVSGRPVFTTITPDQMQRVREVFEFYSEQLGIDFTEVEGPNATYKVVVGDMWPNGVASRPGGEAGIAGGGLAIMDGAETWTNSFGGDFFGVALHEVGHMLGLGHSYDLPPGTTMGSYASTTTEGGPPGVPTEQFPGNNDVIHGQFIYRPDNKDVDIYRFTVGAGQSKSLRVETIAERLANSSNADTVITLYQQTAAGLTIVASNNDYFSSDSFLSMDVAGGATGATYFIAVTVAGNQDFDPTVTESGSGGVSAGNYQLVVDLVDKANVALVDTDGTALDGDGDGVPGGDFNFWFRAAAPVGAAAPGTPKTVFVDKGYTGGGSNGSPAAPFNSLPSALGALASGDILRVVGSLGTDNDVSTSADNQAYEIGRGGPGNAILSDGLSFQVPQGVTMMIDAGAIFKLRGSRLIAGSQGTGTDSSYSSIQVLGTPTQPVFFTSYDDQSLGVDTNPIITQPQAGDWAGIEIHNDVDRAQGRGDYERRGIFLNYIAHADVRFGGGQVTVATPSPAINPIYMAEARPTLLYNRITRSADAAMSADPDSFEETRFTEPRYQLPRFVGDNGYQPDYDRVGPDIRGNRLLNNSVNGIFVRVPTAPGQEITSLNVAARFDDTDIVHVFGENLLIGGTPGGAWTETITPNISLLQGVPGTGGTLAAGVYQYKLTFVDRYGGEGLPSAATGLTVTPGNSSLTINNLPPATGEFIGRRIWRLGPSDTTFKLVAELDRSSTTYVDRGSLAGVDGGLLNQTTSQRARPDARLAIDPGIIVKSLGSRIEAGVSSQLLAEGTAAKPVIFTSKLDDRYGAGGTFDTNNDLAATTQNVGDWGGLVARHLSSMSIDHALIAFGGGTTSVPGGFAGFNAVEFHQADGRIANSTIEFNASGVGGNLSGGRGGRGLNASAAIFVDASQPIIVDNVIRNNLATAINIDADSFKSVAQQDSGRQTGAIDRRPGGLGNFGPLVRGNRLAANSTNGMEVRGGTITTETVWDDTDIVHVLTSEINVPNHHHVGGLRLVSRVDESLVVKLQGTTAGFTAGGRALDITDRIGGTVQVQGAPGFPVVLTSLKDDSVGAGFDPSGLQQFDTNGDAIGNLPGASPSQGDWRSIRLDALSNDRNVASLPELETDQIQDRGTNDETVAAQALGGLATGIGYGDENLRLGFTVSGAVASPQDVDIYSFVGTAGTQVWIDIDRTGASLDSVVELITESGAILAQSDDSLAESAAVAVNQPSTLFQNSNTALIAPNQAQVMDRDPLAVENSWIPGTARDLGSINPRDAGMRIVLPGTSGTTTTYYLRVRSSNLGVGDPRSKLQDGNFVRDGKTTGAYRMQVRLQQTDEVGGSSIHYADVRYATNGLEALATPVHSPLLGDNSASVTTGTIGAGTINLGNLGASDRGALSIAGQLSSLTDVAFYEFSIRRNDVQLIQPAGGSLPTAATHVSTVFDIDYADGVGGPNTNLWVFNKTDLRLVYMGSDSNVLDDRAAPTQGSDQDDMSRGSAGSKDAFIGAQALPVGDYIVAVTNNSQTSSALAQFQYRNASQGGANSVTTRLEPIESVQRIAEDRFEDVGPLNPSTATGPIQVAFESTQGGIASENQVPFTLADLVAYTIQDNSNTSSTLRNVNAMTGALEEDISNSANARLRDLAMSPDGRLVGYHIPVSTGPGSVTDATSGDFVQLNWQGSVGAQVNINNTGRITTFTTEATSATAAAIRQRTQNNAQVGDGIQFNGLTIWSDNALTNASQVMIGVGSRGNGITSYSRAVLDANNNPVAPGVSVFNTTNVVYALNPTTGAALNATGTATRTGNNIVNDPTFNAAGTPVVEMGRFLSGTLAGRFQEGTVTGLAKIGSVLFAVSNRGEFYRANVGAGNNRFATDPLDFVVSSGTETFGGRLPFSTINDPVTGQPINFQGLAAGPTNLRDADGNSLATTLFGISSNGTIYAFDTNGNPVNVFPDGTNRTVSQAAAAGAPFGLAFSPLDVNLWHVTRSRAGEAGHGYPVTFNRSRSVPELNPLDRQSLYFGFENAGTTNLQQDGIWSNLHSGFNNSVNLPGGAKGAVESQPIDLSGYSADDLPMLYFNYYLSTENRNAGNFTDTNFMRDSFRVYATADGGNWTLLATNNSDNRSRTAPQDFTDLEDEYDQGVSTYIDAYGNPIIVQELYDVNDTGIANQDTGGTAPDAWRQARLNLSPFAGSQNLRLRFEFATGGTFNTGNPLTGGVELSAVAAHDLTDGQTVTLQTVDLGPAVVRTFEFDFGLVLNLPGGASIPAGSTFTTPFGTFNLSTTAGPGNLVYATTDTAAQVATKFQSQLQALGINGYINAVRPNVLILPTAGAVVPGTYSFTGLSTAEVVQGTPGVAGTNITIPVRADVANYDTSAIAVRDSMRTVFANTFTNGETAAWSVYGQTLRFFKYNVVATTAPIGSTAFRYGDVFGTNNSTGTLGAGVAERAQNNAGAGVFVDDIIIGFAERGEQVLNAPPGRNNLGGTAFVPNRDYEPRGFDQNENEEGRFQLEIRTGQDYGISYKFDSPAVPPPADYRLTRTYDTNYRAAPTLGMEVPPAAQIADGTLFTLNGGSTALVTFEFNVLNGPSDALAAPTTPGNIIITLRTDWDANQVARALRDAINSQVLIPVTASVLGEMVSGGADVAFSNSAIVMLNGPASVGRTGLGLPPGSPLTLLALGNDGPASEDLGDQNRGRADQGQIIVSSTSFSNSSQWGVRLDDSNSPTSPRNLPTSNPSRLTVGTVLINNIFNANLAGGITIIGDVSNAGQPIVDAPVGRIINNSFFGTRNNDSGVRVTNGATPTILNNIFANFATAISVDANSTSTVVGANAFQNNANPGILGSFPLTLTTTDPLFVNPTAGNFYLKALSPAIDSSLEALAERLTLSQIRNAIGLPPSPMLAPDRDIFGQRRVDDPSVSTPAGLGSNVFKDRGATDRADFAALQAVLLQPQDNDSANVDVDRTISYVRVTSGLLNYFSILLSDGEGIGPDASTVQPDAVRLTENGRLLKFGVDYTFGYNINSRTIRLTPLSGIWRSDSVYEITLNNSQSRAVQLAGGTTIVDGDTLVVTMPDSTTRTVTFRKAPSVALLDVVISNTDSAYEVSLKVAELLNRELGVKKLGANGITTYVQGSGLLTVVGARNITSSRATTATITNVRAIADLAGNALAANRSNTLTQFTIVMPDVDVDYGDTNATPTLQAVNGARHAMLPIDAPLLALGQFADGDGDGAPTASATGDDNDASVNLQTLGSVGGVVQGPSGPATLVMPAGNTAGLDGQTVTIVDPLLKTVTLEFDSNATLNTPGAIAVNVLIGDTPAQVATKFAAAVNGALLTGRVGGVAAVASGANVSLGGSSAHKFTMAAPAVTRLMVGNVELVMPTSVSGSLDGLTFRVTDGAGNVVTFEINNTANPPALLAGTVPVDVDLATATPALLANAIATAINGQRALGNLVLGVATVIGNSVTVRGNDEDGITFGNLFNSKGADVPVTISSTGSGVVDAWIDWNGDGDFLDTDEQVIAGMTVRAGANVKEVKTPVGARIGFTAARFRLSVTGNLLPDQLAVGGEVEDYLVEVVDGTPPVANNDSYTVAEDGVFTINAPGVLANDTDPDGSPLTVYDPDPLTANVEPVVAPLNGQLVLNTNGSFTYTPNLDFFGIDTFVYYATDPRLQSKTPATVTIDVTPVNDAPLGFDDTITILEDAVTNLAGSTFWANDWRHFRNNPNENGQTLTLVSAQIISPAGGTVSVASDALSYTPLAHYNNAINGPALVLLTIRDGGVAGALGNELTTTSTLTINITAVNDRPEFTMPSTHGTTEDAGPVTQANFITGIRPGPGTATDESTGPALQTENQQVSFQVRALVPGLFKTLPAIDAAGQLTYELNPEVNLNLADVPGGIPGFPQILVEVIAVDTGSGTAPNLNSSVPVTFTILPTAINDAPEFTIPATITRLEDAGLVTVPGFMSAIRPGPAGALDEANQTLTVTLAGSNSAFTQMPTIDLATGTLTFQTAPDVNNVTGNNLVVTVTLTDSGSGVSPSVNTTTKTFTLSITPVNDVPRFTLPSNAVSVFEDNEQVVGTALTQIPGFASAIAAGPATAVDETTIPATRQALNFTTVSVSNPALFEVTGQPRLTAAGVLEFDTASDQNGTAVVVVRLVDDGAGTAPDVNTSADQTFTITVRAVNDAPEFTIPATVTALEDAGLRTVPGFATNLRPGPATAVDEAGQSFVVTVTALDPAAFSRQPTIAADGTLVYRTADNVNSLTPGRDLRVIVTLTDDGTTGPAPDTNTSVTKTFTVLTTPVNDAPLFTLPTQEVTVIEDVEQFEGTSLSRFAAFATGVAPGPASATDEATQTLTFDIIDVSSPELFAVAPTISPAGELSFKTASNRNGKSVVIVRLVDSGAFNAPNDNDADRQTFTISITPINDAPLFDIPTGITVDEDQGLISRSGFATNVRRGPTGTDDENGQTIAFTVVAANPAAFEIQPTIEVDGSLTFKTAPNVNSLNSDLTVRVLLRDSGLSSPAPNSNTSTEKTFSITVNAVNDAPIPNPFSINSLEDLQITIQSAAVLLGDVPGPTPDEASQTLTITQVERATALGGIVTPVFTGSVITSMIYTPAPNAVGIDTFLYVVSDSGTPSRSGTGTISIVLSEINDPPSFTKGADQVVLEDIGNVTVANWATNILAGSPSSVDEQATQVVTFIVTADNPALFEVQPTVSSTGTLSFKPAKDAVGSTGVTIVAVDSGSNVAPNVNRSPASTFTITLSPTNDAPVFTAGPVVSVNEDSGAYSQPWATAIFPAAGLANTPATASDESTQVVDFIVTVDKPALFSVQPSLTSAGILSFTPSQNASGVALITVVARDRGPVGPNDQNSSLAQMLTITINAVNDAPVATPDNLVGNENSVLVVPAPGLLVNDTDADGAGDQIKAVAGTFTSEQGATVTVNEDGSVSYDPRNVEALQKLTTGQTVTDRFVYQISDLAGVLSTQATVSVVINGVDDAPIAINDLFTVPVGQSQLLDVLANDTDIDTSLDPRTIVITSLPAFGTVVVNATGVVAYAPGVGFRGIDTFAYTVKDLAGNVSNEAIVSVVVNNVPRASNDTATTVRNRAVTIDVLANDTDLDGSINASTVTIVEQPSPSGTVAVQADGKIVFTPSNNYFGLVTFSYYVNDNIGSPSNVATVQVSVGSAWRNPVLDLDVNADGTISPIDALLIINYINTGRPVDLPTSGVVAPPYFDPSGDEKVTSIDALLVINYLNTRVGSGEGEGASDEVGSIEQAAAPIIVTMVTPDQMVAIAAPMILREMEAMMIDELEACSTWSVADELATDAVTASESADQSVPLDELVMGKRSSRATDELDDFFGQF